MYDFVVSHGGSHGRHSLVTSCNLAREMRSDCGTPSPRLRLWAAYLQKKKVKSLVNRHIPVNILRALVRRPQRKR